MKKIIVIIIAFISITSFAQTAAKRGTTFNLENKVAIQGYDPVAYFTQKKAVKGKSAINTTYEGVIYYFSTQANKDLFLKNPTWNKKVKYPIKDISDFVYHNNKDTIDGLINDTYNKLIK